MYHFNVNFQIDSSNEFARAFCNGAYAGRVYFKPRSTKNPALQLAFRDPRNPSKRFVKRATLSYYGTLQSALEAPEVLGELISIVIRAVATHQLRVQKENEAIAQLLPLAA